jgi:hypothetical protein
MKIAKSIAAVIAGFAAITILTSIVDAVLTGIDIFPSKPQEYTSGLLCIALIYRTIFAVLGGFVVAKLAPFRPMNHIIVLAVTGTLIGIAGVITGWDQAGYPHWYSITLTVLTFPAIWYGGRLTVDKKRS